MGILYVEIAHKHDRQTIGIQLHDLRHHQGGALLSGHLTHMIKMCGYEQELLS